VRRPKNESKTIELWYGTTRATAYEKNQVQYTTARGEGLSVGRCTVSVPKSHRFAGGGGQHWWRRLFSDKDSQLQVTHVTPLQFESWTKSLQYAAMSAHKTENVALAYVHGFNTDFTEAATRAAQLAADLKTPVTGFFSWPSKGEVSAYLHDAASRLLNFGLI
jgi:esterase/lipase superfamily enzyme